MIPDERREPQATDGKPRQRGLRAAEARRERADGARGEEAGALVRAGGGHTAAKLMRDEEQPGAVRRRACEALLNRGFGLPAQALDMRLQGILVKRLADLSLDELRLLKESVPFVACDSPNDDRFMIHLKEEARKISICTKAALAAAKARGVKLGGYRGAPAPDAEARAASLATRQEAAMNNAADYADTIAAFREVGITSANASLRTMWIGSLQRCARSTSV